MSAAPATTPSRLAIGKIGMGWFLASLGMIFAASVVGLLWVRAAAEVWPPPGAPSLPRGLWLSTVLIVLSTLTMEWARRSRSRPGRPGLLGGLVSTLVLGIAFLLAQTRGWFVLAAADFTATANLYAFTYYLLTALHAVHVLGGLIPLTVVTLRAARRGEAWPAHGVVYTAMYWHFLTVVWLVLFAVFQLTGS
ncbi:MAG: heme-copper oxidase subunit III [Acidobacteriota bacterium]|jgi:cytochrome c oxidase subunit 3